MKYFEKFCFAMKTKTKAVGCNSVDKTYYLLICLMICVIVHLKLEIISVFIDYLFLPCRKRGALSTEPSFFLCNSTITHSPQYLSS